MALNSVPFEDVRENPDKYVKIFAEGSPALESLLKTLWNHGVETTACCSGYKEFDYELELKQQEYYREYSNANIFRRLFMNKHDYVPAYDGFVSLDTSTINEPELFVSCIKKSLKEFGPEVKFSVRTWRDPLYNDPDPAVRSRVKDQTAFYITVYTDKKCSYEIIKEMSPEEASKAFTPDLTKLDKYFDAIEAGLEKYFERYQSKNEEPSLAATETPQTEGINTLVANVEELVSQAKSVSEQNRGLASDLGKKLTDFDMSI